jgi:hypothetical protein
VVRMGSSSILLVSWTVMSASVTAASTSSTIGDSGRGSGSGDIPLISTGLSSVSSEIADMGSGGSDCSWSVMDSGVSWGLNKVLAGALDSCTVIGSASVCRVCHG